MPNIIDKFLGYVGTRLKGLEGVMLTPKNETNSLLSLLTRSNVSPQRLIDENKNWVAACVNKIAKSTAKIELSVKKYGKDGQEETVQEHPLMDLLSYVNPQMSKFDLFEITSAHLTIFGNSIWLLDGVADNGKGVPKAIYPLNPKYIKISRGGIPDLITEYEYRVENTVYKFKPSQVIHFRETNADDPLWGMGKLEQSFDSVEADMFTRLWNKAFFQNGARVDAVIEVEGSLTSDQAKQLLEVYNSTHRGIGRAHKTAIIPMGGKLVPKGVSMKDMDFSNLRQVSRDEILAMFGVPKSVLGIVEDVNRANAEASLFVFMDGTISPNMQRICDTLNEFLVPFFGDNFWLVFKDPTPTNRLEELEIHKAALGGKPWMTVNEVRNKYGLGPIENGDHVMTDFASVPLGEVKPDQGVSKTYTVPGKGQAKALKARRSAEKLADSLIATVKQKQIRKKELSDIDEAEWKRFQISITPYVKAVAKGIIDVSNKQKDAVLSNLPTAIKGMQERASLADVSVKVVDEDELFEDDEWINVMGSMLKPIYQELTEKEGKEVLSKITEQAFNARTERVQRGLEHAISLLSESYTETTKTKLRDTLEEGLAEGESIDSLSKRVQEVYTEIEVSRANAVALTETNRIGNFAAKEAMVQSGVVKTVRWYTSTTNVCPFCESMSGRVEDINSSFFEKGDTLTVEDEEGGEREMTLDYDSVENPPLHVNCNCYIRPEDISV